MIGCSCLLSLCPSSPCASVCEVGGGEEFPAAGGPALLWVSSFSRLLPCSKWHHHTHHQIRLFQTAYHGLLHDRVLASFCLTLYRSFACSLHPSKLTSQLFLQVGSCLSYLCTCFSQCPETSFLRSLNGILFIRSLLEYLFKEVFIDCHTLNNHYLHIMSTPPQALHHIALCYIMILVPTPT